MACYDCVRWSAGCLGFVMALGVSAPYALAQVKAPDVDADHAAKMVQGLELFKKHVRPVLEQKCLRCHGGKKVESQFDLADRDSLIKGGVAGPGIVAGKSKDSLLVKVITHARAPHMPLNGKKLPAESIAKIARWIDLGAPYDTPLVAARIKAASWTEKILEPEARQFWAFAALQKAAAPAVKNGAWTKTPLDRFILAKLEQAGLAPSAEANKHLLLRRAYFDLLGVPPPPEATKEFLEDKSADAYPRLIDRLLASPQFGERWARHWLDLARFAESHGFEHDYDRPSAYHYRDFVIQAFNEDLPYDTFVKWQIAGDEYAPDNVLALKATGFLAAGVHSTQITKSEVEKHRYDEMDDQLATIGTSMLGLTIGCARCHDHKYDPIPQRDYYRMLASFTTTVRSEVDLDLDPAGYAKARAEFERAHEPFAQALRKYEAEVLPGKQSAWEKDANKQAQFWEIPEFKEAKSKEGAELKPQSDGSLLASGKNGKFDVYTVVVQSSSARIGSIRLETLADPTFVKNGPGRAANGNFALSDFRVQVQPVGDAKAKPMPVQLIKPRVTFEQKGLPIAAAIDKDAKSAWAIDPQFGKNQAAVFELEAPLAYRGGCRLTFTLSFNNNDGHNLGRFRLTVLDEPAPASLTGPAMSSQVRHVLTTTAPANRSAEETTTLLAWFRHIDSGWRALKEQADKHALTAPKPKTAKCLVATEGLKAVRLHSQGEDFFPETFFLRRGDPDLKEGVARQSFLQVLMPGPDAAKNWQTSPPSGWRTSYRRRALAEWLTDIEHGAGNLLARVIVNRLWQHHLGRGIVATPSDFGARGEPPTHPELLDYLAGELIRNGWRLKPIHKLIMTSAVYRQSSAVDEARAKIDRDNKLCWRQAVRRVEAESIRDAMLSVSGLLDTTMYGPGTLDQGSKRRSIYFTVKRSKLIPMMVVFDAPEALTSMAERPTTTIAPQALHLMNNPQVRQYAQGFAARLPADSLEQAVAQAYLVALARPPSADEKSDGLAFLRGQLATYSGSDRQRRALADFCQVLLCLNEFVYVE